MWFQLVKNSKFQYAAFKIELQQKFFTLIELYAKEFTVHKFHILQTCVFKCRQGAVAVIERTASEYNVRQICAVQVTALERTLFINTCGQQVVFKGDFLKNPVFSELRVHGHNIRFVIFCCKMKTVHLMEIPCKKLDD